MWDQKLSVVALAVASLMVLHSSPEYQAEAVNNGLARTPQLGWNTWNRYGCNINETIIKDNANALVSKGLHKVGYEYIVIDDCWSAPERDSKTKALVPDPNKFPSGIKSVADYVHSLGLKIGIYSDAGKYTCGGHQGSLGYEDIDAKTWASWGIDYLKYDNCYNEGQSGTPLISYSRYKKMSDALNSTSRPILYSMCNWGEDSPWNWATTIANSWRMSGDIYDNFDRPDDRCPCTTYDCPLPGFHCSVTNIIEKAAPIGQKAGPGQWNDLDMLEVGNGGMSFEEYKTMFIMWSALKSPLILGNDLNALSNEEFQLISHDEIIAINQDRNGSPASRIWKKDDMTQLWSGSLVNSTQVVVMYNPSNASKSMTATWADIWVDSMPHVNTNASVEVRDVYAKKSLGNFTGSITLDVPSHGTRLLKMMWAPLIA